MMKKRCLALFCACLGLAGCGGQTPEHERSAPLPAEEETVQQAEVETGVDENGARPALSGVKVLMTIDETQEVVIDMYDNEGAQALLERLPLEEMIFADLDHVEKAVQTWKNRSPYRKWMGMIRSQARWPFTGHGEISRSSMRISDAHRG